MNLLLESFIREALNEKKIMLAEKPCECAEGEKCECSEGTSCECAESQGCSKCGPSEIDEMSLVGGGAITGAITPLGAGPRGKVRYRSGKERSNPLNKSPSYYIRKGPAKSPKRKFGKK